MWWGVGVWGKLSKVGLAPAGKRVGIRGMHDKCLRCAARRVCTLIFHFDIGIAITQCLLCQGSHYVIRSAALLLAQEHAVNVTASLPIASICSGCIEQFAHIASMHNNS